MKPDRDKLNNYSILVSISAMLVLFLCACSTCEPVLYPNAYYNKVGQEQARKDVHAAIENAKKCGLDDSSSSDRTLAKSASQTAARTGVSTATSVASGSVGTGTAISAAGSGLSFLIDWMYTKKAPEPMFRKHVELTLTKQGYQVLGWK
jgi:hypothetical protein